MNFARMKQEQEIPRWTFKIKKIYNFAFLCRIQNLIKNNPDILD